MITSQDWETAYANDYVIQGRRRASSSSPPNSSVKDEEEDEEEWVTLAQGQRNVVKTLTAKQHVVQKVSVATEGMGVPVTDVRISINKGATRWGVSLWRFQVWGHCL